MTMNGSSSAAAARGKPAAPAASPASAAAREETYSNGPSYGGGFDDSDAPGSAPFPQQAQQASARGSPSDVIAAIMGTDALQLPGFSGPPAMPSWLRPGIQFVSAHATPDDVIATVRRSRTVMTLMLAAGVLACAAASAGGGIWWATEEARSAPKTRIDAANWRVVDVKDDSVVIQITSADTAGSAGSAGEPTGTPGPAIHVRVGESLPNGDRLQATVPQRSAYITESTTAIVRPNP